LWYLFKVTCIIHYMAQVILLNFSAPLDDVSYNLIRYTKIISESTELLLTSLIT